MSVFSGNYRIFCAGDDGGKRWLTPKELTRVKLDKESGSWQLEETDRGFTIHQNGSYIAGDTKNGKVNLVPLEDQTGLYWEVERHGEYYVIRCLDTTEGDKQFLDGNTKDSNVYLHANTNKSGSQWLLIPS
jgi:hypothetical protein